MPMQTSVPQGDDYRFGFDIGGTFTDIVVASRSGKVVTGKTLSTPDDIMVGVIAG